MYDRWYVDVLQECSRRVVDTYLVFGGHNDLFCRLVECDGFGQWKQSGECVMVVGEECIPCGDEETPIAVDECLCLRRINNADLLCGKRQVENATATTEENMSVVVSADGVNIIVGNGEIGIFIPAKYATVVACYTIESVASSHPHASVLILVECIDTIVG